MFILQEKSRRMILKTINDGYLNLAHFSRFFIEEASVPGFLILAKYPGYFGRHPADETELIHSTETLEEAEMILECILFEFGKGTSSLRVEDLIDS